MTGYDRRGGRTWWLRYGQLMASYPTERRSAVQKMSRAEHRARWHRALELREAGSTYKAIAVDLGISIARAHQMVKLASRERKAKT